MSSTPETPEESDGGKIRLLQLLASAGLSNEQVGFDPNLRNDVAIKVDSGGITISVPWISQQHGIQLHVENRSQPSR